MSKQNRFVRHSAIAAGILISALFPFRAIAEDAPPQVTVHRQQAGEFDAKGWTTARSTEGDFSVRMPAKFNDVSFADSTGNAPAAKMFTVGGQSTDGMKLSASRIVYRKSGTAKELFEKSALGTGEPSPLTPPKRFVFHGLPALDVSSANSSSIEFTRSVLVGEQVIVLTVESAIADGAVAKVLASKFFDSLVVSRK